MRHGAKAQQDSLRGEMIGDDDLPFVPGPTNVISNVLPSCEKVFGHRRFRVLLPQVHQNSLLGSRAKSKVWFDEIVGSPTHLAIV